jgi:ribonuclease BN (tRNA processing enzyme)
MLNRGEHLPKEAGEVFGGGGDVSRRDFVKLAGAAAATVSLGAGLGGLLASCGSDAESAAATTTSAAVDTTVVAAASTLPTGPVTTKQGPPPGPAAGPPVVKSYVHSKDFSVITIGTSSPEIQLDRGSACTAIQYKGKYYPVDAGTCSMYGWVKASPDANGSTAYAYKDIRAILFSHLHQDHSTNYFDLVTQRWGPGGGEILLAGPPNTGKLHEFLTSFWKDDLTYRMLRKISEQKLTGDAAVAAGIGMFSGVTVKEISGPETFEYDGMTITTAVMTHTMYNLAYRFDAGGKSIVISGDTSYDPDLVALAKGVDVLVLDCDAFVPAGGGAPPPPALDPTMLPEGFQPEGDFGGNFKVQAHMNQSSAAQLIGEANPKMVVATHFRPPTVKDPTSLLAACKAAGFTGKLELAVDGKEFFPE